MSPARPRARPGSSFWPLTRSACVLTVAFVLFPGLPGVRLAQGGDSPPVTAKVTGPGEVVFNWRRDACDDLDIPDVPARAFRDSRGRVQLIASHYVSRRMIGPNLNSLRHECRVIMSSRENPDPAQFDDKAWLHAVFTLDGATIFALVHTEYQGHAHPGRCPSGLYENCWYNAVTLAVSTNGGDTYAHVPAPRHLVASIPYPYEPETGPVGIFTPSNIVHNAADGYYYALVNGGKPYRAQPDGVGVMRTTALADPSSWRAWGGKGFTVRFINPYQERSAQAQDHVFSPLDLDIEQTSLTFNTYLRRFLVIGVGTSSNGVAGIYFALSDNLIRWTRPQLLLRTQPYKDFKPGAPDPVEYPSALDPDSSSRAFETTGKHFYLYFTRFNWNRSPYQEMDRDLVRIPVELFR